MTAIGYVRKENDGRYKGHLRTVSIQAEIDIVDHGDTVEDMVRYGKDIEKAVLARGLRYHVEDRVLVCGNKTIVFR